jgi:hypothetical protein
MGIMGFMATSTSAMILATVTTDRRRNVGNSPSMDFVPTGRTMSTATQVLLHMTEAANTTPAFREVDIPVEVDTPVAVDTRLVAVVTAKPA